MNSTEPTKTFHFNMTSQEIQEQIQDKVDNLLKGPPSVLRAMANRAHETEESVMYFRKRGNKDRVRYEMYDFLRWLEKTLREQDNYL